MKEPAPTTVLSILPVHVLESIFHHFDSSSIDCLYEADPYIEYVMDNLVSIQRLKQKLYQEEEMEFRKKQFALWRSRLKIVYKRYKKELD